MLYLDKKHDPRRNAYLIEKYCHQKVYLEKAIQETDEMFENLRTTGIPTVSPSRQIRFPYVLKKMGLSLVRPIITVSAHTKLASFKTIADPNGDVYPEWRRMLENEYEKLQKEIDREVNVLDYGAVGDGLTDNTEAFKKAIGRGRVKVVVPEGEYITKGIRLPSWTCLTGEGKGKTMIKLSDLAPKGMRLVTNSNHWRGNHHISVEGLSLDWNIERLGDVPKTSTWGNHSSCLTYANVTYGWVKNVEGINPGLHCFDVSSTLYDYSGDGYRARGGSQYVWLDKLNGYGFGDDGITTHHSDNIFISNCHMCDPSGRAHAKGFSNSNGIEVDDGSRNVWLVNNSTARCFGGVEIKAHHTSSAGNNVQIVGHLSVNDNRSYNFRHIGHHKNTDPDSKTAANIRATNIIAIKPVHTELYQDSTPRAMVISAYKNVVINHFTVIGDPDYDYRDNPVIALQYKARNVILNSVFIRDFHHAGSDIKIFGGNQHADQITLRNIYVEDSAPHAIDIGQGVANISLQNIKALAMNGIYAVKAAHQPAEIKGITAKGYKLPALIAGKEYHGFS